MSDILYTDPTLVEGVRVTPVPVSHQAVTGYGPKVPTRYLIRYMSRNRRVYVAQYGNSGSAYVIVNGESRYLDTDTEHRIAGGE